MRLIPVCGEFHSPIPAKQEGRVWRRIAASAVAVLMVLPVMLTGCGGGSGGVTVSEGIVNVVAAENFWGSIAEQLGGTHANVTSIVTDPNADPHEYESSTENARAFAETNYVILTGAGYDAWAQRLLDANPSNGRKVLNVADLLGKTSGDNPHFWYDPNYVEQVADQITKDLQALDPADTAYFVQQRTAFEKALQPYHQLVATINQKYGGAKIGSTESIFAYMAEALGLNLISPPAFMNAVSEGTDPPIDSVREFQGQIAGKQITVLVYNRQTGTAISNNLKDLASQQGIPVVGITETLQPPGATFQDWQVSQLKNLQNALAAGPATP
jgi:zinc/manganese transport system substrate-binding protein